MSATPRNLYVWGLTVFAAFGGFLFGYDIGIINGVKEMCSFRKTLDLLSGNESSNSSCAVHASCSSNVSESTLLGLIVSVFSLGCLIGALLAGGLSDMFGRKLVIIAGGCVFIVGGLLQGVTFYFWMILLGRIVAGVGVGILSMVVPVYNAELAPKTLRGRLVSLNQLAITAGIMVSFLVNLAMESVDVGWRVSLGLQAFLGTILVGGMLFLPETPRWLVKNGQTEKAEKVMVKIRCCDQESVQEELSEIISTSKKLPDQTFFYSLRSLLHRSNSTRLLLGVWIQLFQQLIGMNVIMYYSTSIFCQIGVEEYISTALVGTLNFLTTFLAIVLVDKLGRKSLLLLGTVGMFMSILIAGAVVVIWRIGQQEEGEMTVGEKVAGYAIVFFVCLFVFNFAYGWGPTAWVVTSEIFPLNIRGLAVSITTSANWLGNFIVAMLTPILISSRLGIGGTFFLLAAILVLAFLFILLALPETKGLSLERIDELFVLPWKQRVRIFYYLRCGCPWMSTGRSVAIATQSPHQSDEEDAVLLQPHKD